MGKYLKRVVTLLLALIMVFTLIEIPTEVKADKISTNKAVASARVNVGKTFTFGSYPQSEVKDATLLSKLNAQISSVSWSKWTSFEYTYGDGSYNTNNYINMKYYDISYGEEKYRAIKFTEYRPQYAYSVSTDTGRTKQDDNGYYINQVYWFKYEPIEWVKLDDETGLVVTSSIIDSQCYSKFDYIDEPGEFMAKHYSDPSMTHKIENYEYSSIREWLIDDFYNTAFNAIEKADIQTTHLISDNDHHIENELDDKVFLLTQHESRSTYPTGKYNEYLKATEENVLGTDYARANGLGYYVGGTTAEWLTRTAESSNSVWAMVHSTTSAYIARGGVRLDDSSLGVRPAVCLKSQKGSACTEHNYQTVVTTKATPTTDGATKRICSSCGAEEPGSYSVIPKVSNITLSGSSFVYTGAGLKPAVIVKDSKGTRIAANEYIVTYANNVNAGTATVTVKFNSAKYSGTKNLSFTIHNYKTVVTTKATPTTNGATKCICSCGAEEPGSYSVIPKVSNITLSRSSFVYTGAGLKPAVIVKDSKGTRIAANEYIVTYANNVNAGTAKVTVKFKSTSAKYSGTKNLSFTIVKSANKITASNVTKTYSTGKQTFNIGASRKGNAKLSYSSDNKKVAVNSAGKVTIAAKFIGKATITIKSAATTNYKATSKTITVTVNPTKTTLKGVSNLKGNKLRVTWKKNAVATGYMIRYSTSSSFKSGVVTKTITKNSIVSATYKGLKKNKTYYVQIRSYKKVGKVNYYSGWSSTQKIKIKK